MAFGYKTFTKPTALRGQEGMVGQELALGSLSWNPDSSKMPSRGSLHNTGWELACVVLEVQMR